MSENFINYNVKEVKNFFKTQIESKEILNAIVEEKIDGKTLLLLNEHDLYILESKYKILLGDLKKFSLIIHKLQSENRNCLVYLGVIDSNQSQQQLLIHNLLNKSSGSNTSRHSNSNHSVNFHHNLFVADRNGRLHDAKISPDNSVDGSSSSKCFETCIRPEFFKTVVSLGYAFLVTWITAFVMVIVHERVPDSKRYPPLPDIFLDNVPHISWAFFACEVTGAILFSFWVCVLLFHKYRMILLRRFFALGGTVFLLRCFTMLITSLSVPGIHLQCQATDHKFDDRDDLTVMEMLINRVNRALEIWSGLGMAIQGVRTCGDYMFSGHTVALTLLNFFITEYTPRNLYFLHTVTWLCNMFGIFFILAAHEHYSIDVFIAFYISSRLFLYYHTLANNQALMSSDSNRTRIWFPLFSYFESSVEGIIPNEYNSLSDIFKTFGNCLINTKDLFMLTTRRIWLTQQNQNQESNKRQKRSQSHTPKRNVNNNKSSMNGNDIEKMRRSISGNLAVTNDINSNESSLTNSTRKYEKFNGPKKEN
ncbi:hypothetical protein PVAND_006215 [Polypedilum vanderplanki]|uniref:Sphingomyelin synthase-like domain-containing protein n=1 Tax=Polypedilum vanderplanki TaxID=319348 RepID=A0A9J6C499_POLVA|nr:hypothetical protein PVAND_006215 [Polypedilum vanderplanki]